MNAITFNKIGEPNNVLEIRNLPIPEPDENEVRVKVLASPINPADLLFINGKYRIKPEFSQIAGLEGIGIIEKVGKNLSLPINALVSFRHKNIWADYAIVPFEKLTILPDNFPIEKGSQFSLNPITAYALLEQSNLKKDDWLLLTAGNSAISKIIIQLAKLKNIRTIAVIRSNEEFDQLKALGATKVLNAQSETNIERILEITEKAGVNCVLDAVGGDLITALIKTIATNGQLISYGLLSNENVSFHNATIIFKNLSIKGFGIDNWLGNIGMEKRKVAYDFLIEILAKPEFKMPISAKFPFKHFNRAIEQYQSNNNQGKILLTPD